MKITFDKQHNNYVETALTDAGKYHIIISAIDPRDTKITTINSVELTFEQLSTLLKDLGLTLEKEKKDKI